MLESCCNLPMNRVSSIFLVDTEVPNIESDYILLLGYSILYKEYNLTRVNHHATLVNLVDLSFLVELLNPKPLTVIVQLQLLIFRVTAP